MTDPLYEGCNVGDLVVTAITRGGDRVAFICDDTRWTYRQLGALVSQVVQALAARGLQRGDAVATLSANRPEAFLITAAAYLMGLRLTWMNPTSSEDDHAYILEDSGVTTLFVDPLTFGDRARVLARRVPGVARMMSFGPNDGFGEDLLAATALHTPARLVPQAHADDVCVLIYTGGTTGKPKGVAHTHRVHVTMIQQEMADWDWPAEIRFLALTPITHASGAMIMPVLMRSGTYAMTKGFTAEKFVHLVETHRITATFLVPTMIYVLLDSPARQGADLSSLKLIIYGASPMSPTRLIEGIAQFGPVFMQLYAQSEAPNTVCVLHQHEHLPDHLPENYPERLASCGTPCVGNQVRLLDDDGHEVADGQVGEICVRGPLVMQGYWNKPAETAQALRHGCLYTGDMARRDAQGYLYIVDRSKDMIISGGFNVYPREVEDVLSMHPAVASAAVVGVPDAKWGEAVRALVVLKPGAAVAAEALMALVRDAKGAVYTPKAIDFVDALPTTGLGKLDKKAIRAVFWQGQQRAVH